MTTYAIERSAFACRAALAERIRGLVAEGYRVEVTDEEDSLLYSVDAVPASSLGGPAYWLRDARGRIVGTLADVDMLVREAAGLRIPVAK